MRNIRFDLIVLVIVMIGLCGLANGQCTDLLPSANAAVAPAFIKAKPEPIAKVEKDYSHVLAQLDRNVRFKVALSNDMTGAFSKTNDFVTFTTLENVYGIGLISAVNEAGHPITILKRCVLIARGTPIYGLIDHANSRYPFSIGGKGKLFVTVDTLKLDNGIDNEGVTLKIRFAEPILPPQRSDNPNEHQGLTRPCKHAQTTCVVGRRTKLSLSPGAIGAGAATGLLLVRNGVSDEPQDAIGAIAALSLLESLSKVSGIEQVVNPPDAILKEKMVFEIETREISSSNPLKLFVPITQAEPKAAEKPAEQKPKGD